MRAMEIFFSTLPRFTKDDAPRVEQSSDEAVVKIDSKTIAKASLPSPDNKTALPHLASLTLPINTVTDVIVFYTGCCGQGKGDYSACGTLVEMISSYVPYPVILLSNVRGVEQFNSLYQNKNQTASINGKRVEIMALYDFRDNQHKFAVKGYVEHGCSRLGSRYMQEYVLKNSDAKAAIVLTMIQGGLPNYLSETKDGYRYTPKVSVFAAGFGPRMSGVPFAHSPLVSMGVFQEKTGFSLENFLTVL